MKKAERSRFSLRRLLRLRSSPGLPASSLLHSACQPVLTSESQQGDRCSRSSHERSSGPSNSVPETKVEVLERVECRLCLTEYPSEALPKLSTCPHYACYDCLQMYLRIEILESRVPVSCPQCSESIHPSDIRMIIDDKDLYDKYEDFMVRRVLAVEPDARWCPAPDCSYAVIASGCASCPKIECLREGCGWSFCYHCKAAWHPNQTCDAARAQRSPNIRASSLSFSQDSQHRDDIKPCPRCNILIVKMDDGSCNHMTCSVCAAEFCWLCMKEISDLHYLSPSGCTFWGKKPWSRKKKILWQLGTLVGAPVGIALLAGIAVPAIIIGIPVWVGRKLFTKYEQANKHKRNLIVTGGVVASVVVSPVLAGLAVSVGVPILLFYVYGVVPVSLCRSGGCGVTASPSGGVRLDFHSQSGTTSQVPPPPSQPQTKHYDDSVSQLLNASIGEAGSLSGGSASGGERELDRASAQALAGSIAHHRLEVEADVVSCQISVSSETGSSFSERSSDHLNAQPHHQTSSSLNTAQQKSSSTGIGGGSSCSVSVSSIVEDLVLRNVHKNKNVRLSTYSSIDSKKNFQAQNEAQSLGGSGDNEVNDNSPCPAVTTINPKVGGLSAMCEKEEDEIPSASLDSVCLQMSS